MVPWSETNTEAFAGVHNEGNRILLVFDEASAIHDLVWEVAKVRLPMNARKSSGSASAIRRFLSGAFANASVGCATAGIPCRSIPALSKAPTKHNWSSGLKTMNEEDSDFVRIRVRGEFPRSGSSQLIPPDLVAKARRTKAQGFEKLPIIMAADVARFGDDQTVIGSRQGRKFQILGKYRGLDTVQVAERIITFRTSIHLTPWWWMVTASAPASSTSWAGYSKGLFEFHGGERPRDFNMYFNMYFNRRSEVWGLMRDWFHNGSVEIPDDPELEVDLTALNMDSRPRTRFNWSARKT